MMMLSIRRRSNQRYRKVLKAPFVTYGDSYLDIDLEDVVRKYNENDGPLLTVTNDSFYTWK